MDFELNPGGVLSLVFILGSPDRSYHHFIIGI